MREPGSRGLRIALSAYHQVTTTGLHERRRDNRGTFLVPTPPIFEDTQGFIRMLWMMLQTEQSDYSDTHHQLVYKYSE